MVARLLTSSYPDTGFLDAAGVTLPADLEAILRQKNRELSGRSGHLVSDELLDAFTWTGTAEDVANQIRAVAELGIEDVTVLLHPPAGKPLEPAIRSLFKVLKQ